MARCVLCVYVCVYQEGAVLCRVDKRLRGSLRVSSGIKEFGVDLATLEKPLKRQSGDQLG